MAAAAAALTLVAVGFVAVELVHMRGRTPPIRGGASDAVPGSVASLERLVIGGVEQHVLIRGRHAGNPVLLFLHGGPGMPAMYLAHAFQREWERDFVVVHWDRRGAGKSYGALAPGEAPTVRQTLDDTHELARHLRARFGQARIYLLGHSWGSYLGLLAVHEHPELYMAFIGTGQMSADAERANAVAREHILRTALTAGDSAVVARMRAGGNPTEADLFRFDAQLRGARSYWPLLRRGLMAPEYTLSDIANVPRGAQRVGQAMRYDVIDGPLDRDVLRVDVPIAFFLGRHDYNTPSVLAAEYFERIESPVKRLVWFEESAHFPFLEESDRFRSELLRFHHLLEAERLSSRPRRSSADQ